MNGASTGFNINATNNRLMGVSGATTMTYGYDAQGNTTAVNGVTVNQYDPFNRLSSASGASDYVNPEGHRLRKASSAGTTYFAPEGDALLAENDNGTWIDYVWLNGRLIGRVSGSTVNAIHDDQTGRPQVVTDAGGAVVWKANNYPFTQAVTLNNIGGLNLGFPGQYYDAERGTWNNGFRDYDPSLGRYIESDPMGLFGGGNTYAYVGSNPLSYIDPLGLQEYDAEEGVEEMEPWVRALGPNMGRVFPETQAEKESRWQSCPRANSLPPNSGNLKHIFRDSSGHVADTPANRDLLLSTANNLDYLRGPGAYGSSVYTQFQSDGSQVWVITRGGVIQNGGVNSQPWAYIPGVGLRPGR